MRPNLPGFDARPARMTDIESVVALRNASSMDTMCTRVTAVHWQKRLWQEDNLPLDTNTQVVTTPDGMIVGYLQIANEAPYVVNEISGAVHPDYRQRGIGTFLLWWAKQRARELARLAAAGTRIVLLSDLFDSNQPGRRLLRTHGYADVRHFIHLHIEMDSPPPEPVWPEGVTVYPVKPEDWPALGAALKEAFQDHWGQIAGSVAETAVNAPAGDAPQQETENTGSPAGEYDKAYFNTPGLCFVALAGEDVVGSCLCNAKTIEFPHAGYLGSLSVRRPWRRRGIGLALTLHALGQFYRRGTHTVLTDTDGESFTGANLLYPKAGMSIYRQEILYEKEIRPGKDVLKRRMEA